MGNHAIILSNAMKFELITSWEEAFEDSFLSEWENLANTSPTASVFTHPEICKIWVDTYLPLQDIRPLIVKVQTKNGNIAILPLVIWRRNWKNAFLKVIAPLGHSDYDYHEPLFKNAPTEAEYSEFWDKLILELRKINTDKISIEGIRQKPSDSWKQNEICPKLSLSGINSEEDLLYRLKTSLRGDIRRQIRHLEELGELTLQNYTSFEAAASTFSEFMTEHSARWPNAYKAPHFHENLLKHGLPTGLVDFSALCTGDRAVAWHLGFKFRDRYYYYMPAGHREFAKLSPTKIHLFKLISRAGAEGVDIFEHLRGDETYKQGWSDGFEYVHTYSEDSDKICAKIKRTLLKIRKLSKR